MRYEPNQSACSCCGSCCARHKAVLTNDITQELSLQGNSLPIKGNHVLEFGSFVAAPFAARLFGDFGAEHSCCSNVMSRRPRACNKRVRTKPRSETPASPLKSRLKCGQSTPPLAGLTARRSTNPDHREQQDKKKTSEKVTPNHVVTTAPGHE